MAAKKKTTAKANKRTEKKVKKASYSSVVAKGDDGSVQVTFTIPFAKIKANRKKAAEKLGKDITIPGFRKGKAPVEKVLEQVDKNQLLQETLADILPKLLAEAINKHKIKPATYPKFELLKADEDVDWEVRAITCEIPEVDLSHYKKTISEAAKTSSIWTPSKGKEDIGKEKKDPTPQEKEQEIIKLLLENIKVEIPQYLIGEEANQRLSMLLTRIEKLGVDLDSYLKSIGKSADELRKEYEKQAQGTLSLDIILSQISQKENITVKDSQVDDAIKAASADPNASGKLDTPEQRTHIQSILIKRATLDSLIALM